MSPFGQVGYSLQSIISSVIVLVMYFFLNCNSVLVLLYMRCLRVLHFPLQIVFVFPLFTINMILDFLFFDFRLPWSELFIESLSWDGDISALVAVTSFFQCTVAPWLPLLSWRSSFILYSSAVLPLYIDCQCVRVFWCVLGRRLRFSNL